MKKIVIAEIATLALVVVLTIPIASAQPPSEFYLIPDTSIVPCGDTAEIQIWLNATDSTVGGIVNITYNTTCANITGYTTNTTVFESHWVANRPDESRLTWMFQNSPGYVNEPAGVYHIGNFTIHCYKEIYCETDLLFDYGTYLGQYNTTIYDVDDLPFATDNGTFTCGEPTEESFSKDLYEGWNLVSLPLTPSDNSASSVLASVWDNVSAVYRYNATSKQFESASTMEPGTGYFVYVTQNRTWTYSGTPCTSMSTELKQGLNMVGWLNCSKDISDALSSIEGDYWYVARWNAVSQSFEVYNPVAPPAFNDFDALERGTGYFISAKADTTLSASC